MKKLLLLPLLAIISMGAYSQVLYNMADATAGIFRASGWGQTNNSTNGQVVLFDDVNIKAAPYASYDSLAITKLKLGLVRYANAPAATLNVWYATIDPSANKYSTLLNLPPKLVASYNLPANTGPSTGMMVSLGDSITSLFNVAVDTGVYYNNYASFAIGISYSDTTGNAWYLGKSTGDTTLNDDVMFVYDPVKSVDTARASFFGGNPRASFYMALYGKPTSLLPVKFASINGVKKDNDNIISWSTAMEQNNAGFEVERSQNGKEFYSIAKVASLAKDGSSSQTLQYKFTDADAGKNDFYYRIKQTDFDGQSSFSKTIFIKSDKTIRLEITSVFPNPAESVLNIKLSALNGAKVQLMISDMHGRVVKQQTQQINEGINEISLDVNSLNAGTYILKAVSADGTTLTQTFIKK